MSNDANEWMATILRDATQLAPPKSKEWLLNANAPHPIRLIIKAQEELHGGRTWWVRLIWHTSFTPIKGQHCGDMPMLMMVLRSYLKDAGIT